MLKYWMMSWCGILNYHLLSWIIWKMRKIVLYFGGKMIKFRVGLSQKIIHEIVIESLTRAMDYLTKELLNI